MRLDLIHANITENLEKKRPYLIKYLQDKYHVSDEPESHFNKVINSAAKADPIAVKSNNKKTPFISKILNWWLGQEIELPDDIETVKNVLTKYNDLYSHGKLKKKIDEYESPGDLRSDISEILGTKEVKTYDYLPLVYEIPGFKMYEIVNFEQGQKAFEDSGWCVQHHSHFYNYGPPYYMIVTDNNKRYALMHRGSNQIKDVHDRSITLELAKPIEEFIKLLWPEFNFHNYYGNDLAELIELWPGAKDHVMKDPRSAYLYAKYVIKGAWPEAEPYIIKDIDVALRYALEAKKSAWPELEPYIIKDFESAATYAIVARNKRWPEAEPYILKEPGGWAERYINVFGANSEWAKRYRLKWAEKYGYT